MNVLKGIHKHWAEDHDAADKLSRIEAAIGAETSYDELAALLDWDYETVRDEMKLMDEIGLIKAIKGSRGHKSRVIWLHSPSEIAAVLKGGGLSSLSKIDNASGKKFRQLGKSKWSWTEVCELLANEAELLPSDIVLDISVGEAKRNFAKLHQLDEREISVSIGS